MTMLRMVFKNNNMYNEILSFQVAVFQAARIMSCFCQAQK